MTWTHCRMLSALLALLLTGCNSLGFTWAPPADYLASDGDATKLRYVAWPGDGARGVELLPTVRWDREKLTADLGGLSRLVIQVATEKGRLIYRLESTAGAADSWLLQADTLRVFSRPLGTRVQADPEFAERGRLRPARRYILSLHASHTGPRRVFESLTFETLDLDDEPEPEAATSDPSSAESR